MHILVIGRGEEAGTPEGHAVTGFTMYRKALKQQLGMSLEMVETTTLAEVEQALQTAVADVVFVMVHWSEPAEAVLAMFKRVSRTTGGPKLIFLDYCASTASPHFGILPYVDGYAKRQVLKAKSSFAQKFEGGCLFTDYLARQLGYDLKGWYFGSKADPNHTHKVVPGWNLAVAPQYRRLLKISRALPLPWEWRPFAINCRLGQPGRSAQKDWYDHYRLMSIEMLKPLQNEFRCTGSGLVRRKVFIAEMLLSKIAVSPFGWGETCFRDYEAVCAGALLLKPSMEHLNTSPNIYIEGKTYVSCRWDLADVPDLCRHYLAHPGEAKQIVRNAQEAMTEYFENNGFVADIGRVLQTVGVMAEVESGAIPSPPVQDCRPICRNKLQRLLRV